MCFAVIVAKQVRIVSSVLIIMTGFERDFNSLFRYFLKRYCDFRDFVYNNSCSI